jgi:hypothetical protein
MTTRPRLAALLSQLRTGCCGVCFNSLRSKKMAGLQSIP